MSAFFNICYPLQASIKTTRGIEMDGKKNSKSILDHLPTSFGNLVSNL